MFHFHYVCTMCVYVTKPLNMQVFRLNLIDRGVLFGFAGAHSATDTQTETQHKINYFEWTTKPNENLWMAEFVVELI